MNKIYPRLFVLGLLGALFVAAFSFDSHATDWHFGGYPTATATATPSYDTIIVNDKPLGFWPLKDNAGSTTAVDLSGNSHNCTTGGTAPTFGVTGDTSDSETAASFSAGWLSCPMPAPSIANSSGFTIEFLMKSTNGTVTGLIDTNPSQGGTIRNFDNNNAINPQNTTTTSLTMGSTAAWHLIDQEWYRQTSGSVDLGVEYIDGVSVTTGAGTPSATISAGSVSAPTWGNPMVWGAINTSCGVACYSGTLQKLAIYGYWLTPTQVHAHFVAVSQ